MTRHKAVIMLIFTMVISFETLSQIEKDLQGDVLVEIDELIVDETLSKGGHDFYEIFYSQWTWPDVKESFTIYIKERPARAGSTQVQVYVNDLLVFESFLQPRHDMLVELSNHARRYTYNHIVSHEQVIQQLQGDDMSGSGIF